MWKHREHGVLETMVVSWDREESVAGLGKGRKPREFCSAALLAQAGCELQGGSSQRAGSEQPCPDPSFICLKFLVFMWERLGPVSALLGVLQNQGSGVRCGPN